VPSGIHPEEVRRAGRVELAIELHVLRAKTRESWEGYFQPFADGPLEHASATALAARNPTLLVRERARAIRADGLRFFLSTGGSHGSVKRSWTFDFQRELQALRVPSRLWAQPPGVPSFGRNQLPAALKFAEPPAQRAAHVDA
jgi:hypothetical protein